MTHDFKARVRSYELLADVFELHRRGEAKPRGHAAHGLPLPFTASPGCRDQILAHRRQVGMDLEGAAEHRERPRAVDRGPVTEPLS